MNRARALAFQTLLLVERGGYASDLLAAGAVGLDPRDAGLATEIVMGVLRYRAQLDFLIQHYTVKKSAGTLAYARGSETPCSTEPRPSGSGRKLDPEVRIALRMGIYQLRYLERIPPHAAVSESVDLVKRRKRSAAAFVNAVLRKVDRAPIAWPDRATGLSHPSWLLERWDRQYGEDTTAIIARANLQPPETYTIETKAGGRRIQDAGSQAIVPLLRLESGQSFLDVCAAPGNKTAQALESGARAIACDINPRRLSQLRGFGIPLVVLDGTRPLPFGRKFDRILLDVPCSGTGTLARNPEIKWRLQPSDIAELQRRQAALLENAVRLLAPGGLLVYSTCSLEREENDDVVAPYPVIEVMRRIPGRQPGDGFFAAVIRWGKPANG